MMQFNSRCYYFKDLATFKMFQKQLEATTRYIHCENYDFVVKITEEEYNEHIAAMQQTPEESN